MPKVARIRRGLDPDVPKLKRRASGFPGLVKPIAQHPVGKRLVALVLNQLGSLDLRRPGGDALDHLGKISGDLDSQLLAGLVLLHVQRTVPNVGAGQLEHVGRPLASQQGRIHGVLRGVIPFLPHLFEFVAFTTRLLAAGLSWLMCVRISFRCSTARCVQRIRLQGAKPSSWSSRSSRASTSLSGMTRPCLAASSPAFLQSENVSSHSTAFQGAGGRVCRGFFA